MSKTREELLEIIKTVSDDLSGVERRGSDAVAINRCTMTLLKLLNEDNRITQKVDETLKKINDTKAIIAHKEEEMKKYNNLAYGLECDIDRLENEIDDSYKAIEVLES